MRLTPCTRSPRALHCLWTVPMSRAVRRETGCACVFVCACVQVVCVYKFCVCVFLRTCSARASPAGDPLARRREFFLLARALSPYVHVRAPNNVMRGTTTDVSVDVIIRSPACMPPSRKRITRLHVDAAASSVSLVSWATSVSARILATHHRPLRRKRTNRANVHEIAPFPRIHTDKRLPFSRGGRGDAHTHRIEFVINSQGAY